MLLPSHLGLFVLASATTTLATIAWIELDNWVKTRPKTVSSPGRGPSGRGLEWVDTKDMEPEEPEDTPIPIGPRSRKSLLAKDD